MIKFSAIKYLFSCEMNGNLLAYKTLKTIILHTMKRSMLLHIYILASKAMLMGRKFDYPE